MNQHSDLRTIDASEPLDTLDTILLGDDTLLPSSGFAASVMDAIEQRASLPAAIPIPWEFALPALAAWIAAAVLLVRLLIQGHPATAQASTIIWPPTMLLPSRVSGAAFSQLAHIAAPTLLALACCWACLRICRRMVSGWTTS